ncbi:hypothetical protein [uncultured Nostoc sp.]|uniref:hypothetical protein n=1 Tax=uncultured Nostoc sp. TaxID=340711 RepID=UPI0035CB0A14
MNFELVVQLYKYRESLGEDIRKIAVFVLCSSMMHVDPAIACGECIPINKAVLLMTGRLYFELSLFSLI